MPILIKDNELIKEYHKIWGKVQTSIRKGYDSKPV